VIPMLTGSTNQGIASPPSSVRGVLGSPRTRVRCFGYHQRPHPPRPLLTQPRPFYGHRQVQITREASHRADEVENVVLVPCRDQSAKQAIVLACISPHSLRLGRVVVIDWRRDLPLLRDAGQFFDLLHYRRPVAEAIEQELGAALTDGARRSF
jgi:hypothetical protein